MQALCDRLGIVVNGELRTIGTPAQLKHNYGKFFKLTMITAPADANLVFDKLKGSIFDFSFVQPFCVLVNSARRREQLLKSLANETEPIQLCHLRSPNFANVASVV